MTDGVEPQANRHVLITAEEAVSQMVGERPVVFVLDDDPSMRQALEDLVGSIGMEARAFASPQEFLHAQRPDAPSCLVLDVRLPGCSGLALQKELAETGINLPVIFITGHADIATSVRAMKAGAIEFLIKPLREQDILDAIYTGIERHSAHRRAGALRAELHRRFETLTRREREIMQLVTVGHLNKQIAAVLDVSEATVKVHRAPIMHKMRASSLAELVRMADALGLSHLKAQTL